MSTSPDITVALVELFRSVFQASWQGALAIALVMIVRRTLGARVPARWPYLLWFLVLARLLVPTGALPRNPASLANLLAVVQPSTHRPVVPPVVAVVPTPVHVSTASPALTLRVETLHPTVPLVVARSAGSWWAWAAWTWLGGVALFAVSLAACVVRLHRRLRRETFPVDEETLAVWRTSCRRWLGQVPPRLLAADWIDSPALVGWWRPVLLVPRRSLHTFLRDDWEHVFAHEIAHLRWRDHRTQFLLLAAGGVHWFNPVVWFGLRRLRADRELAADEWVLRHLGGERALAYGETLFKTLANRPARSPLQPGLIGISEDGMQMKHRLRRIAAFLPRRRLLGSLAGLGALLLLGTVVLGQGTSDPQPRVSPGPEANPTPVASVPAPARTEQSVRVDLLAAAHTGDPKRVSALFNSGDPKLRDHSRPVALGMLDDLLARGDVLAFTTLYDALQFLPLNRGAWKPSDSRLSSLVKEGRTDALDALLARGLDLGRLGEFAKSADASTSRWIEHRVAEVTQQRADIDALEKAAGDGDLDTIRRLIDAGADVNVVGPDRNTPLIRAVFGNHLDAAQLLLDRGAQVDKPRLPGWNYTPLCLVNSVPMAELLKEHGANVHAKLFSRDVSILTYVASFANSEVVQWFLRQGLDPKMIGDNHKNLLFGLQDGRTAELLLDAGVDPNQVDDSGNSPICYARSGAVTQALLAHGAKVTGFKQPLLPNMVSYGFASADAVAAVLRAGADRDPATLQAALERDDRFSVQDYPEKEKVKQVLLAAGAQPTPASEGIQPSHHYAVRVSAADGTLLGGDSTQVHAQQSFGPSGNAGWSTLGGTDKVEGDGAAPVWIEDTATTAVLAATSDGFATAYAGPFTPPTPEKLGKVSFTLDRGFQGAVVTLDEAGQPIVGAKLTAYYPGPPKLDLGAAVTDASGRGVFDHVGTAPLTVQVSADGYGSDTLSAIHLHPDQPYRWTLKKTPSLPGLVVAAATGQPVAAAQIKLAGVRGPHDETHADPSAAPMLAVSDAQGRFALTSLRPDSIYDLYVEAPGHGGVLLNKIRTTQGELKVSLGPELAVRGKVIHIPAGRLHGGELTLSYNQAFLIGDGMNIEEKSQTLKAVDGEADFVVGPLYANAVDLQIDKDAVKLTSQDLPKSGVVIDLAPSLATPPPTPVPPPPTPAPSTVQARVVNARGQPIAGASIRPYTEVHGDTWHYPADKHKKTHTDQDGRFSYSVPGYTKVGVMVVAPGYARKLAVISYGESLPDIVLTPGVQVTGRLLKDEKPVPGVEVGIAQVNHDSMQFLDEIVAKSDQDGRFVLPDVAPQDRYELHAKRDSLRTLGVTAAKPVVTGEAGTVVSVGDLSVEAGVRVTGRIMLPDGSLPTADEYTTEPDGRRLPNAAPPIQLHVYRESADDYQYINLEPDLRFSFPALAGETLSLSAWVPGYKLRGQREIAAISVSPDLKPVEMVYDPESAEAKARALHPVFTPPSTPAPSPPSAEQLAADARAAQGYAAELAAQPRRTEAQWRAELGKVTVGMTFEEVIALLPPKTASIDYLQRDEYDEAEVHTSFYGLDGEYAVALTFDFKGDEAWNAAGQPKPRPKADENHLTRPPVLMRHDQQPDKDDEIRLETAHKA